MIVCFYRKLGSLNHEASRHCKLNSMPQELFDKIVI